MFAQQLQKEQQAINSPFSEELDSEMDDDMGICQFSAIPLHANNIGSNNNGKTTNNNSSNIHEATTASNVLNNNNNLDITDNANANDNITPTSQVHFNTFEQAQQIPPRPTPAPMPINQQTIGFNNSSSYDVTPNERFIQNRRNERREHPYKQRTTASKKQQQALTPEQIMNKILMQTTNISKQTNRNTINQTLKEGIKKEGCKELEMGQATITIKKDNNFDLESCKQIINNEWVNTLHQLPPPIWEDKKRQLIFIQFINCETKISFLNSMKQQSIINNIKDGLQPNAKTHFTRRPVRIEINNVRQNMNKETIIKTIQTACGSKIVMNDLKEGKLHQQSHTKIISFLTDAAGVVTIADKMKWKLPYYDATKNVRANLYLKINAKPFTCRDCFAIGVHNCKGKCCTKCASDNHLTRDCDQEEFCSNCNMDGHSAKDKHCPRYLNTLIRNLVQMDIPAGIFNKESRIVNLIENIQLK